jgi:hypothetical protein
MERGHYVALSHCWGPRMPVKLTASTLDLLVAGFSVSSLPKTFQDAIEITREIGVSYLWIDSLCILQDSSEDWAFESRRMSDVYSNALLTIAAEQSVSCDGGIFSKRSKSDTLSIPIRVSACECNHCTIFARWQRLRRYPFATHSTEPKPERSGLHSRGWALQERLLSTRILHFSRKELAWECATRIACECRIADAQPGQHLIFKREFMYPGKAIGATSNDTVGYIAGLFRQLERDLAGATESCFAQLQWQLVIYEFTARSLTMETDRLPALSGIADLICRRTSQAYYFGILGAQAVRGLLWQHDFNSYLGGRSKRLARAYAPSWSFGSVTGRIRYLPEARYFHTFRPDAMVHHISSQHSSTNPYGPGTGILTIEGYIVQVRVDAPGQIGARRENYIRFAVQTTPMPSGSIAQQCPTSYFYPDITESDEESEGENQMFLLIIGSWGMNNTRIDQPLGLMLVEEPRAGRSPCYKRVGLFSGSGGLSMGRWANYGARRRIEIR